MSIQPGTRLGPYEVQDVLGQGAMGVVYRAYHAQLERTGAVKVLQGIAPDVDSTARFRHEAQAIAQMRHPNILNVFDFGEFEGTPYMIIEYVPGGSLASRMKNGPMAIEDALEYLRGIAAGLDYAHSMGIVHRDVKPANVLLEKDGTPVIADFGLVKLMQSTSLRSMTGVTTGTPAYMAPEQVTGSHAGPAADRYSLATIAYEMLTGVIPFDGGGLMEVLYAQVHRDPPTPSSRRPELGVAVDAVVMRGMAKDPSARWETCEAFVDALEKALSQVSEPALARTAVMSPIASTIPLVASLASTVKSPAAPAALPHTNGVNAGATVAMAYPAPAQRVATKKKSRRRLFSLAAAAVLVLLLIGAFAVCAARPSVSLSPSTVVAGESVLVTATRVPANQVGEIQLHSTLHTYPFHADSNGGFKQSILIPRNIGTGDHIVQICWTSACHASATLHVIAPVALVTDPPGSSPTPGVTPSPGTPSPTPGASPQPTTAPTLDPGTTPRPTSYPSPIPSQRPAPAPSPSPAPLPSPRPSPIPSPIPSPTPPPPPPPSPTPNPCPTSTSGASITTTGGLLLMPVTVNGYNFTPLKTVTVRFFFPAGATTAEKTVTATVGCNGFFTASFTAATLDIGTGKVTATDSGSPARSATTSVQVT